MEQTLFFFSDLMSKIHIINNDNIIIPYFALSTVVMMNNILRVSDLGYLPGRTFSIISPSVGAECSCLVSLRAKNHIWRTWFRRMCREVGQDMCLSFTVIQHTYTRTKKNTLYGFKTVWNPSVNKNLDISQKWKKHIMFEANPSSISQKLR